MLNPNDSIYYILSKIKMNLSNIKKIEIWKNFELIMIKLKEIIISIISFNL